MISVHHLTKYYGDHLAVDDISFEIESGHVYGFLGPNGAGKSTTMNIMTGCLSATEGTVLIDGHDIFEEPDAAKKCMGYLPEHPPLYVNESVEEYLHFVAEAKGLHKSQRTAQVEQALEQTGITHVRHRRISQLSKGYKQRVGIAQALLGNPKVIILDEPTVGLDPIQIIEIRDLIRELGKTHTVIFSSHILSEVQAICDRIVMIAKGKLVALGSPDALQKQLLSPNEILLTTDTPPEELTELVSRIPHISHLEAEREGRFTQVKIKTDVSDIYSLSADLFRSFAGSERIIYEMTLKKGNLEDVFLELTEHLPEDRDETCEKEEEA